MGSRRRRSRRAGRAGLKAGRARQRAGRKDSAGRVRALLAGELSEKGVVFAETPRPSSTCARRWRKAIEAWPLTGDLAPGDRTSWWRASRSGRPRVLLCTERAARAATSHCTAGELRPAWSPPPSSSASGDRSHRQGARVRIYASARGNAGAGVLDVSTAGVGVFTEPVAVDPVLESVGAGTARAPSRTIRPMRRTWSARRSGAGEAAADQVRSQLRDRDPIRRLASRRDARGLGRLPFAGSS